MKNQKLINVRKILDKHLIFHLMFSSSNRVGRGKSSDMKIILLLILASCTQKYADYDLIRKVDFNKESYERPIPMTQIVPVGRDHLKACFNQWFFFSNAENEKESSIPMLIRSLCPGQEYLLQSEMKESWWTTILFTRSCVSVETKCAEARKL